MTDLAVLFFGSFEYIKSKYDYLFLGGGHCLFYFFVEFRFFNNKFRFPVERCPHLHRTKRYHFVGIVEGIGIVELLFCVEDGDDFFVHILSTFQEGYIFRGLKSIVT